MKIESKIFFLTLTAAASLLTACQDEDFGYAADDIKYEKNFTDVYGEIPSDKSWDLSTAAGWGKEASTTTRATTGGNQDLVEGTHYVRKDWWTVDNSTLAWMNAYLTEGKDNRYLGSSFVLKLPANGSDFAIVPIYQGHSAIMSDLEIKINGYNQKEIWKRCQDIQCWVADANLPITNSDGQEFNVTAGIAATEGSGKWYNLGYFNGYPSLTESEHWDQSKATMHPSYTDNPCDEKLRAKPIYFRSSQIQNINNGYMYLSLHNTSTMLNSDGTHWSDDNSWTTSGNRLTSINSKGHMLAVQVPASAQPANLPSISEDGKQPSKVMMIACEDAEGRSTDNDVNDVVFLVIGYPDLPEVIPTTQTIKKRYMCEDLGATDDFDFNDIVIDVTQTMQWRIEAVDESEDAIDRYAGEGVAEGFEINMVPIESTKKQIARIAHVCGTIPIQVKVGDLYFPKVTDPTNDYQTRIELAGNGYKIVDGQRVEVEDQSTRAIVDIEATDGWNPNEVKVVTGWDPAANNVQVFAQWSRGRKKDGTEHSSLSYNSAGGDSRYADFAGGNCTTVSFPWDGDVPYMIATDQDVPWMGERVSIPQAWVESGNTSVHTGAKDQHGNINYLDYGNNQVDGEAVVWTGVLHRYGSETGLNFLPGSAEIKGMDEAINNKGFKGIVVYTTTPGTFGIKTNNADRDGWVNPTSNDAEYYNVDTQSEKTYDNLYRTVVMLTNEQINAILQKGLVITLGTASMELRQISLLRPQEIYKKNNEGVRDSNLGWHLTRYIVNAPTGTIENGKITADDRGTTDAALPFQTAAYRIGTTSNFKAVANVGYRLSYWKDANGNEVSTNPTYSVTVTEDEVAEIPSSEKKIVTLPTPVFEACYDPDLRYTWSDATSRTDVFEKGKTKTINIKSKNRSSVTFEDVDASMITVNEVNIASSADADGYYSRQITIVGNTTGTTTFKVVQQERQVDGKYYSVSRELTITVTVFELPYATEPLEASMYHKWSSSDANATITNLNQGGYVPEGSESQAAFGNLSAWSLDYADLSEVSDVLVLKVTAGNAQLVFNKVYTGEGNWDGETFTLRKGMNENYFAEYDVESNLKYYVIDLAAIKRDRGYVHLNSINGNGSAITVESMMLDSYSCKAEGIYQTQQLINALTEGCTSEATPNNNNTWEPALNSEVSTVYGVVGNIQTTSEFDNLYSPVKYLKVIVASGYDAPRFFFNYDLDDHSKGFVVSTSDNRDYLYSLAASDGTTTYYVNVEKLRTDKGSAHLNSIKSAASWLNIKVSEVKVGY